MTVTTRLSTNEIFLLSMGRIRMVAIIRSRSRFCVNADSMSYEVGSITPVLISPCMLH